MLDAIGEGPAEHNAPALRISIREVVEEYEAKKAALPAEKAAYEAAHKALGASCMIGMSYAGRPSSDTGFVHLSTMEKTLLSSAWMHVYAGLGIAKISSAKDRDLHRRFLEHPTAFTLENIREQFGEFILDPRYHTLKAVAECFTSLDQSYKSHSKVKIGVQGLPKRVIVENCGEYSFGGYGEEKIKDIIRCILTLNEMPMMEHKEFTSLWKSAWNKGQDEYFGITLKRYKGNGNCHVIFSPERLKDINEALAEFYGDVLPDCPEENAKRAQSTAVSKDLAFYPTPDAVTDAILNDCWIKDGMKILEPSCGNGGMMKRIMKEKPNSQVLGIEVHKGRVKQCKEEGLRVVHANFLATEPMPEFDVVIMNPPFVGKHYQKHVEHAFKFLKPGGVLKAVLPATARYDHGFCGDPKKKHDMCWRDLPVASFRESGTNVPTGIYTMRKKE